MLKKLYSGVAFIEDDNLPFKMCHASNILQTKSGFVLTVFFGGTHEGTEDTAIYLCRAKKDEALMPSVPVCLAKGDQAHWNPVLFELKDGSIVLIYKKGNVIASWQSYVMHSHDEGLTWSAPSELVQGDIGGRGPVRNKPIRLKSGRILCPASLEDGIWRSFIDRSDDELKTLHKSNELFYMDDGEHAPVDTGIAVSEQSFSGKGIIQPALWEDETGVHALMRSTFGFVARADSTDAGATFGRPYKVNLPNNNSGLDAVYLNGVLYAVCNPVPGNWGARTPLTIFSSEDGLNFKEEYVLESGAGEYSYPCIRAYQDHLLTSYTYNRRNIAIAEFSTSRSNHYA